MNKLVYYSEVKINSFEEYKHISDQIPGIERYYLSRGQVNATWDLKPRIERVISIPQIKDYENYVIEKCQKKKKFSKLSTWELFAKLQHYYGFTRLIDFTYSFEIALFFGINDNKGKHEDEDFAVWLIDYCQNNPKIAIASLELLNRQGIDYNYQKELDESNLKQHLIDQSDMDMDFYHLYPKILKNYPEYIKTGLKTYNIAGLDIINEKLPTKLLYPNLNKKIKFKPLDVAYREYEEIENQKKKWLIENYGSNKRISCQKGLFLYSTNTNHSFMDNLTFGPEFISNKLTSDQFPNALTTDTNKFRRIIKLRFNSNLKNMFRKHLEQKNISYEKLFPDGNNSDIKKYAPKLLIDFKNKESN